MSYFIGGGPNEHCVPMNAIRAEFQSMLAYIVIVVNAPEFRL